MTESVPYQPGSLVSSRFEASIVAASYFASLCGCLLTIEMLHRRGTALGNLRSWLETLGCATAMGLVGIWCMHFIGNRAIILGDGHNSIQLVYNPGYTTLSVFLPIIGLTIAFSVAEAYSNSKLLHWALLICTGVFAGLSIVGMHYLGNFGISNYKLTYARPYLVASMIIAIGDCLLVLILFYTWREKWINSWWKRLSCAVFLAGGTTAMHFTASTSCVYRFRHTNQPGAIHSRNIQVAVAGALCAAAAVTVLGVLFFTRHRKKVLKKRSQKVMLACAMFDPEGRLLVTTEGILPAKEITDRYNHRSFDEDFDSAHPVFQWIFRVTRNWSGVSELIPKMKSHLNAHKDDSENDSPPGSSSSSATYDPETYSDYSIIFRERFCAAAAHLASALNVPLERIGVLYDKIVDTGTFSGDERLSWRQNNAQIEQHADDLEKANVLHAFGKGQLLFLTRQLNQEDTDKLLNAGFRFAHVQQVGRHVAETMQIPMVALEYHIAGIKHFVDNLQKLEKPGTWLSCFAIIPKPYQKGFDVMVKKTDQDQLPDVQLLPTDLQPWQNTLLTRMDGLKTRQCLAHLEDLSSPTTTTRPPSEKAFAQNLHTAITNLGKSIPSEWYRDARLLAKPVQAHYSSPTHAHSMVTTMYAFCVIADMHTPIHADAPITRAPLSFFSARQRCYAGSPDHGLLALSIHQEFGPLLARKMGARHQGRGSRGAIARVRSVVPHGGYYRGKVGSGSGGGSMHRLSKTRSAGSSRQVGCGAERERSGSLTVRSEGSSVRELVEKASRPTTIQEREVRSPGLGGGEGGGGHGASWGGILVNSETVVKSDSNCGGVSAPLPAWEDGADVLGGGSGNGGGGIGGGGGALGTEVMVSTSRAEETFVDVLANATRLRFVSPISGY